MVDAQQLLTTILASPLPPVRRQPYTTAPPLQYTQAVTAGACCTAVEGETIAWRVQSYALH